MDLKLTHQTVAKAYALPGHHRPISRPINQPSIILNAGTNPLVF